MEGIFTGKIFLVLPVANRQTLGPGQREKIKKCHWRIPGGSIITINCNTENTMYKINGHIRLMPECSLHSFSDVFDEQHEQCCQHGSYLIHREEELLLSALMQSCFISISVHWVLFREGSALFTLCVYMEVVCYGYGYQTKKNNTIYLEKNVPLL